MAKTNNNSIVTPSSSQATLLRKLTSLENLTQKEAETLMHAFMSEGLSPVSKAAILTALAMKGETVDEITCLARVMRKLSVKVPVKNPLLDTCGTGGSGLPRLNVSTASAFILAACGVCVAKYGNRSASGRCGSFDVLEALGAKIELGSAQVAQTIKETNLGFIFAPLYHPAMKNIMPVRRELGIKTIFNTLGPLTNPARASYQILGVSNPRLCPIMIEVLRRLGVKRAMVVYGEDGLDEITVTTSTRVWELTYPNPPRSYRIKPENFGIKRVSFNKIKGGDAVHNAQVVKDVLQGVITDARADLILLNAASGLYVYGKALSIKEGFKIAKKAIAEGKAKAKLDAYIKLANSL